MSTSEAVSVVRRAWDRLADKNALVFTQLPPAWQLEELFGGANSSDLRVLQALLGEEEPTVSRWLKQHRWVQLDLLERDVNG
ncbi:hypothetical protein ACUDCK_24325 [Achromobacter sp. CF-sbj1-Ac2-l]|uniref:hypothetical protein n=1 Tax=Achromobacter TaxID=222 RepID=UPI001FD25DBE|nr:hypothetical protein [Achromobacter dolens]